MKGMAHGYGEPEIMLGGREVTNWREEDAHRARMVEVYHRRVEAGLPVFGDSTVRLAASDSNLA